MIDWKRKLTSRKLWIAVIGLVSGIMTVLGKTEQETAVIGGIILQAASVLGYLIGEGLADNAPVFIEDGERSNDGEL